MNYFSSDKKYSDPERWICLYPAYINSCRSIVEGRRIPKEKAVENPTVEEMRDVLSVIGFSPIIEKKMYSREKTKEHNCSGRVKVQLKNNEGIPLNSMFINREMIPKLKSRGQRGSSETTKQDNNQASKKKKQNKSNRK